MSDNIYRKKLEETYIYKKWMNVILPQMTEKDKQLHDLLVRDINAAGCDIRFTFQIPMLEREKKYKITPIIISYIGRFDRMDSNMGFIDYLGEKGNYAATDFLIEEFKKPNIFNRPITDDMSERQKDIIWNSSRRWSVSNALLIIKDKSRLDQYIELINDKDTHDDCVFIIELVGKIKTQKSWDCLISLLDDENYKLVASALEMIKYYYKDHYDEIEEKSKMFLESDNSLFREIATKNLKHIQKHKNKIQ